MAEFILDKALFRTKDIVSDFPSVRSMDNKLKNLIKDNRIIKIKNGLYAMINPIVGDIYVNRYEIGTNLFEDSCIAYHSALEFYGLANQMFTEVQVYTQKRNDSFFYDGLEYNFYPTKINEGMVELEQNTKIVVTDLERTIIDCIDRINVAGGLDEIVMALNEITYLDEKKLKEYLDKYNEKFLFKKAGFLLSKFNGHILPPKFFDYCHSKISFKTDDISENKKLLRESDKYWHIKYPTKLINKEN